MKPLRILIFVLFAATGFVSWQLYQLQQRRSHRAEATLDRQETVPPVSAAPTLRPESTPPTSSTRSPIAVSPSTPTEKPAPAVAAGNAPLFAAGPLGPDQAQESDAVIAARSGATVQTRRNAIDWLRQYGGHQILFVLLEAAQQDPEDSVRTAAAQAAQELTSRFSDPSRAAPSKPAPQQP
jgi:cytoskeletal protein RodZ